MNRQSLKKILIQNSENNRREYEKGGGQISLIIKSHWIRLWPDKRYQKRCHNSVSKHGIY